MSLRRTAAGFTQYSAFQTGNTQPQPVYGQPQTVYGQPQSVYGQPQSEFGQHDQPGYGQHLQAGDHLDPWMVRPWRNPICPPGLEYLCHVNQLLVKQQVELLEAVTGYETKNKYKIQNNVGQQVYFAAEETDVCSRHVCGRRRGFTIHITDNIGQEVIRVSREFNCCLQAPCCVCIDACGDEVQVEAPPGQVVGYVKQKRSCLAEPRYAILNAEHEEVLKIVGPCCTMGLSLFFDNDFSVYSDDGEVGKISKQWSGLLKECFTDADNFGVSFPMDLDVKMKAVMIGAVFLIDFMFFEK